MKLVQVAEQNKRYYTKEFIHGFNTGAKTQYEADSKERRGRWEPAKDGCDNRVKCAVCFKIYDYTTEAQYYNYCPNCGARMEVE